MNATQRFGAVTCMLAAGCTNSSAPSPSSPTSAQATSVAPAQGASSASNVGVGAALAAAPSATVTVSGQFLGWKGPCLGSPPTRSAWQLADSADRGAPCIYVDGPFPDGASGSDGADKNIKVRVEGMVLEEGGKRFMKARRVERL